MATFKNSRVDTLTYRAFTKLKHIDILRDDLIHPIVCGNKWRKLKHALAYVLENNYETLVTFGGAYSNHVVATAFAGKLLGIKTHAFIRGDEKRTLNHYEKLALECGMTLQHVDRTAYRDKIALFEHYFKNNERAFFLDEGGNHPLALKGCAEILDELSTEYDYIVLPLGTGTTMEGLVQGIIARQLKTKVLGISSLKNNFELNRRLEKYDPKYWQVFHDYHRGKYAKSDLELLQFNQHFQNETGIVLETVYTGKMMMGFLDLLNTGFFKSDDKVLLVHTGGLLNQ
ncbi:MAG: pyridoxal-phosphate dependent enzyme [bacterium]|nr:pyridoxal-phosphate dependent enzyme [bacterium]